MFQIFKFVTSPASWNCTLVSRLFAATFFVFLFLLIVLLNSGADVPVLQSVRKIPSADKIAHVAMYGILALLVNMAWGYAYLDLPSRWIRCQYLQLGSFVVLFFSLFEEFSQQFFPTRTIDAWDAIANLTGVVVFTIVSVRFAQFAKRSRYIRVFGIVSKESALTNEPSSS